jgi:hypothetical protein
MNEAFGLQIDCGVGRSVSLSYASEAEVLAFLEGAGAAAAVRSGGLRYRFIVACDGDDGTERDFDFETKAELDAFAHGLEAAAGWRQAQKPGNPEELVEQKYMVS